MTTMMKKTPTYHSYDQYQLKHLSDHICEDIENLLHVLGIDDYKILDKMITMSCPIHGGDNESAFNLYYKGDSYRGNWKCRTHQCENTFKSSIIGFVRGCLSRSKYGWSKEGDDTVSFKDAITFLTQFSKKDLKSIKIPKKQKEKNSFVNMVSHINPNHSVCKNVVNRNQIKGLLQIPSQYFLSRNYLPSTLIKYDVGECLNPKRPMHNRAVVPIYDMDHKVMVGCTGRSINGTMPKWKHSDGFKAEEHLYNLWYAKDYIKKMGVVILVESPGNVWRLEEAGIHNSVAIFGSALKDKQKMLLDISGAMTIITIMDNDDAGKKAAEQIFAKCSRTYNVKHINLIDYADIGEMSVEQIQQQILPQIEKHILC
jgi:5S rRNA maturation endonuclease (ribonuclease M5)